MKSEFQGSTERRSGEKLILTAEETDKTRTLRIEMAKVEQALLKRQANDRPLDEYAARQEILRERPQPDYRPKGVAGAKRDTEKLAADRVTARYAKQMKDAKQPFEEKIAGILDAARVRQGLPLRMPAPAEQPKESDPLAPEEITDDYIRTVEALTEQENQRQASPEDSPYPLSWPDERQALIDAARAEAETDRFQGHERD